MKPIRVYDYERRKGAAYLAMRSYFEKPDSPALSLEEMAEHFKLSIHTVKSTLTLLRNDRLLDREIRYKGKHHD